MWTERKVNSNGGREKTARETDSELEESADRGTHDSAFLKRKQCFLALIKIPVIPRVGQD